MLQRISMLSSQYAFRSCAGVVTAREQERRASVANSNRPHSSCERVVIRDGDGQSYTFEFDQFPPVAAIGDSLTVVSAERIADRKTWPVAVSNSTRRKTLVRARLVELFLWPATLRLQSILWAVTTVACAGMLAVRAHSWAMLCVALSGALFGLYRAYRVRLARETARELETRLFIDLSAS